MWSAVFPFLLTGPRGGIIILSFQLRKLGVPHITKPVHPGFKPRFVGPPPAPYHATASYFINMEKQNHFPLQRSVVSKGQLEESLHAEHT